MTRILILFKQLDILDRKTNIKTASADETKTSTNAEKPLFTKDLKKHNLKRISFHGLRHSCGSLLNEQGYTLKDIQEWLGHADIQTTANIYLHLDIKRKVNITNSLSNTFT